MATWAQISEPIEQVGQASSTVTRRLVLRTDARIVSHVDRAQDAQVDHLGLDALAGQRLGGGRA